MLARTSGFRHRLVVASANDVGQHEHRPASKRWPASAPPAWAGQAFGVVDQGRAASVSTGWRGFGKTSWMKRLRSVLVLPGFCMSGGLQNREYGVLNDGLEGVADQIESLAVVIGIAGTNRFGQGGLQDRPRPVPRLLPRR